MIKVGLGQDGHQFSLDPQKSCIIGGVVIEDCPGLDADSDGDVIFHSICNAITSITHIPIMGKVAIELCKKQKITNSLVYLKEAIKTLVQYEILHVALTIEGGRPRLQKWVDPIRLNVSKELLISIEDVGITVNSGNGLTRASDGLGLQAICLLTVKKKNP